jgi:hypothetical protein
MECGAWLNETRGGTDFGALADAFVADKRRGEIQPSSSAPHLLC